jgi:7-cyano-7-deazaguanine synthase
VVALLSGGLDSTVLAYVLKAAGAEVIALTVQYGQKHWREAVFADRTVKTLEIEQVNVTLPFEVFRGSALTDHEKAVPEGHYEDESMKATVVPNRNMMLLATATALAVSRKAGVVAYGAHSGDHAIYPDCRSEFAMAMDAAISLCDWDSPSLIAPFLGMNKADIVRIGAGLGVPFEMTWSCYKGGDFHCGKCGTCVERIEAFKEAGVTDPTEYLK